MSADAHSRAGRPFTLPERYRVRRHIATGGMASVWCAEDLVLGRSVAIKILAERFADDQLAMRRFKREARAAARVCTHPHVVTVYDVGDLEPDPGSDQATGRAFIVMEYLAGGTVADAIHHDSVRRHEAMRWLREAGSALDHAHERGIVHRDIKPANFLLDRSRVLHVTDFGIARLTTEDTITTSDQLFGTAAYLSPEQALGNEATSASDRYALAVAAFELLVGERPFGAPHFSAQARQHIEEPPPAASERNRTLPPAVDEVLFEALAKDPGARPPTAGAFVASLHEALTELPPGRQDGRRRPGRMPDPAAPAASTAAGLGARRRPARDGASTTSQTAVRPPVARAAGTSDPIAPGPGRRGRAVALGSLVVAIIVVAGIAIAATAGSHGRPATREAARTQTTTTTRHVASPRRTARAKARTTASTTATTAPAPTATVPPTAVQLQSTGHAEMLDGNYQSAIPTLKQAVSASSPGSTTYAYALYDLGRSMVLSGDPGGAIPVLQERLKIPNQTSTVQTLLDQAYAAAGQGRAPASSGVATTSTTTATTPAAPPSGSGSGHGRGHDTGNGDGGSGGAGIVPPGTGAGDQGNGGHTTGKPGTAPGAGPPGQFRPRGGRRDHPSIVQLITAAAG